MRLQILSIHFVIDRTLQIISAVVIKIGIKSVAHDRKQTALAVKSRRLLIRVEFSVKCCELFESESSFLIDFQKGGYQFVMCIFYVCSCITVQRVDLNDYGCLIRGVPTIIPCHYYTSTTKHHCLITRWFTQTLTIFSNTEISIVLIILFEIFS